MVRDGHQVQDHVCVNERLRMASLLHGCSDEIKKTKRNKKPMRSTLVVSRNSDVTVDICVAYIYEISVNKEKQGAEGCTMGMDG